MKEEIINILNELRPEFDFSDESLDFINEGMLDSFDVVALVDELEQKFGIKIDGMDVLPENFRSLDAIMSLIEKNKK